MHGIAHQAGWGCRATTHSWRLGSNTIPS